MPVTKVLISEDPFLKSIFLRDAYRLEFDERQVAGPGCPFDIDQADLDRIRELQSKSSFITAKVNPENIAACRLMQQMGFYLVDTNLQFEKAINNAATASEVDELRFRCAIADDQFQIPMIASRAFRYSRFHLDPQIPDALANMVKSFWAGNYFLGKRGDEMVVAVSGNRTIGFTQLLYRNDKCVIDLIAVDPAHARQGAASGMIQFAETLAASRSLTKLCVGTQIANGPSIALYEKLGFRLASVAYIFHYVGGDPISLEAKL